MFKYGSVIEHKADNMPLFQSILGNQVKSTLISNKKELGDVLWYISNLCTELNFNLEDVALQNLEKLKLRASKGKIRGSGDDR